MTKNGGEMTEKQSQALKQWYEVRKELGRAGFNVVAVISLSDDKKITEAEEVIDVEIASWWGTNKDRVALGAIREITNTLDQWTYGRCFRRPT